MTLVVDASVAVKWFFEESGHATARTLLDRPDPLMAPSLVLAEIGNATWKRHKRGEISEDAAYGVVALAPRPFAELASIEDLFAAAAHLAFQLGHPIYDCFYIALAARERIRLVTFDKRLAALADQAGTDVEVLGS